MYYDLSARGVRGLLLKSKLPYSAIFDESFGFDLVECKSFRVFCACLRRRHHRCMEKNSQPIESRNEVFFPISGVYFWCISPVHGGKGGLAIHLLLLVVGFEGI